MMHNLHANPLAKQANASTQNTFFMVMFAFVAFAVCFAPLDAFAQTATTTPDAGNAMWLAFKSVLFGATGLVISAVILSVSIFVWMRRGIGEGLVVAAAGFALFLIPALVIAARNAGQTMSAG